MAAFCVLWVPALAQPAPPTTQQFAVTVPNTVSQQTKATPAAPISKPSWSELSAVQQESLKPLAASWNSISESQKRKWLEVSKNFKKLSSAEQTTLHSRMVEWVAMSPQDRAAARLNFAKTKELSKSLSGDEKKAKWETYQALSPDEKAKLAAKGSPKPAGAATAVQPVPTQKLAVTPKASPSAGKASAATPATPATPATDSAIGPVPALAPAPAK